MDQSRQQVTDEVCLHLLTKMAVPADSDPIGRIWSIGNWVASLNRVIDIRVSLDSDMQQRFSLTFDAGRDVPDLVEVERIRTASAIQVNHLVPPPGIKTLSARWWCEGSSKKEVFARRTIVMDKCNYSADKAVHMFRILRENVLKLLEHKACDLDV
jgi:hypothetical protein